MRIKPIAFGVLVVALFAGTIGVTMAAGAWQTTGRTAAGAGAGSGSGPGAGAETGSAEGATSSSDVKGWMAIGDVAAAAGVDLPVIIAAFALPADTPPETALKDLESDVFSVTALRTWLAERTGPSTTTPEPDSGAGADPASSEPAAP
jgi:hypothetical protein